MHYCSAQAPYPLIHNGPNTVLSAYLGLLHVEIARFTPACAGLVSVALIVNQLALIARALPYTLFYAVPNFLGEQFQPVQRGRPSRYIWRMERELNPRMTPFAGERLSYLAIHPNLLAAHYLQNLSRRNFFCHCLRHPRHHSLRNVVVVFVEPATLNTELLCCFMKILFRVRHRHQMPHVVVKNLHVSPKLGGDDGIRTRDLLRDREAC